MTEIASLIIIYYGRGLPRHRLDRVQHPNLINLSSFSGSTIETKLVIPPYLMMLSRLKTLSLEILLIAHIACSTISFLFDLSKSTNKGIPPFYIIV